MKKNNYAFIDSQNLHLSIKSQGWELDYKRFFVYLKDKFKVKKVFMFIGYMGGNESLYTKLQQYGYILVFRPTLELKNGIVKGNVDAELVLHTMINFNEFDKAVIITGDGDFHCLIEYLEEKDKLERLVVPNKRKYSSLLKRFDYTCFYLSYPGLKDKIGKNRTKK